MLRELMRPDLFKRLCLMGYVRGADSDICTKCATPKSTSDLAEVLYLKMREHQGLETEDFYEASKSDRILYLKLARDTVAWQMTPQIRP